MSNHDNVTCWVDCWVSSISEPDLVTDEMQADHWNKRSGDFGKDGDESRRAKKTADFFALLEKAGFSPKGAKVLDIGCGPGSLAIPLAKAGASVTALDISRGMLNRIAKTAIDEGLSINPVECSWWTADIDELGFRDSFDLVIASMTPGIKDVDTFAKMISCSRQFCYYSSYIRKDPDKVPPDLCQDILGKLPKTNMFSGFLYPFMYLYLQGIHPVVQIYHKSVRYDQGWSEAADRCMDYLGMNQHLSTDSKEKIREYYQRSSIGGMCNADYQMYSGMMVWSVNTI